MAATSASASCIHQQAMPLSFPEAHSLETFSTDQRGPYPELALKKLFPAEELRPLHVCCPPEIPWILHQQRNRPHLCLLAESPSCKLPHAGQLLAIELFSRGDWHLLKAAECVLKLP